MQMRQVGEKYKYTSIQDYLWSITDSHAIALILSLQS
jgi:hypothetical protein